MYWLSNIGLYARTLSHLKPIQILNRLGRKLFPAKVDVTSAPPLKTLGPQTFHIIGRPESILGDNGFIFLNKNENLSFPVGWNDPSLQKLWLYNLHYFEGLLNPDTSETVKTDLIKQWIHENPPGKGNGWEPYPNSLRISNWIKWALSGGKLNGQAVQSLAIQARFLAKTLEYHLLGNHLFANAKALVMAGLFFSGKEADAWFKLGTQILKKQIPEQFLDDGAHFELSTTYHALLTEDLFDIIQIMQLADKEVPKEWLLTAQKALKWLHDMTRPDGLPPLFNDAAYGITASLEDLTIYGDKLGLLSPIPHQHGMQDLAASGYFRYDGDNYSLFGDAGQIGPSYLPGHAHCDMLSFELFAHGKPIIVDTGISTYEVCDRRHYERSTAAHNTVQIGDKEQSEIWSAFRVGRRAKITKRIIENDKVNAECKSYSGKQHKRDFHFSDNEITITDAVSRGEMASAFLHLHPDVEIITQDKSLLIRDIRIDFEGAISFESKDYQYAPEFHKLLPAKVIEITFIANMKTIITL